MPGDAAQFAVEQNFEESGDELLAGAGGVRRRLRKPFFEIIIDGDRVLDDGAIGRFELRDPVVLAFGADVFPEPGEEGRRWMKGMPFLRR